MHKVLYKLRIHFVFIYVISVELVIVLLSVDFRYNEHGLHKIPVNTYIILIQVNAFYTSDTG